MFAGDWFDDHAEPAAARSRDLPASGAPVRILLFDDCRMADRRQMTECEGAIRVVDTAGSSREVMNGVASLRPDVILMRTDGDAPTADFRATALALSEAKMADRAVMMVGQLAGFLGLAVKAGAAGLLPVSAPDNVVVPILRDVRERFTKTTPVGMPRTTGELDDPRRGGGEM